MWNHDATCDNSEWLKRGQTEKKMLHFLYYENPEYLGLIDFIFFFFLIC